MKRVLVADDNEDAASSLALLLELQGCEVRAALDGVKAIQLAESFSPDIAFLDITLPGCSGHEVARTLRRHADAAIRSMLLVALTGWASAADKHKAIEAGFDFHFAKPLNPDVIATLVDRAPGHPAPLLQPRPGIARP